MKVEISVGEAIDKYSILEIKWKRIQDETKKIEINKEMDALHECLHYIQQHIFYYQLLVHVNEKIWDMTDDIKSKTPLHSNFAEISHQIFEYNQKRFRIKKWFNLLCDSNIREQKSYSTTHCKIKIEKEETIFSKIPELNYLAIEYDTLSFDTPFVSTLQRIFNVPTFLYDVDVKSFSVTHVDVNLENYQTEPSVNKEVFEFPPIRYLAGGLLGDFIHSLSIVQEKFYKTGRKGIVYISNDGDQFRHGLENTYKDTYSVIMKQKYIKEYILYNNGTIYDINLNTWREHLQHYICRGVNLATMYSEIYDVSWGRRKWLDVEFDEKYNDKVLVNTTYYRWTNNIDYNMYYQQYGDKMIYVGNIDQYNIFVERTNLRIPFQETNNFHDMCVWLNSCKLFIGSFSGPLSLCNSFQKDRIAGFCSSNVDNTLNYMKDIWDNVIYV